LNNKAVIVGCGYVGQRLAQALRETHSVLAIVRSEKSRDLLRAQGIEAEAIDLDTVTADTWPLSAQQIEGAELFYLTPPPSEGLSDLRLDIFLRRVKGLPRVFVYMGTTGVYGNQGGGEVDESTPVDPQTERANRRMSAEHMTRVWCNERQVRRIVLRVPGIYGRGRIALSRLQRGEPFVRIAEAGINNRIHVDDLVDACIAVAKTPEARGVYNASDGNGMSSTEFMQRVAQIAGLPPPVEISLEQARREFSAERLSFLNESRRVTNKRLLTDLGLKLRYADIDAGIRASL
jgi:nucleoside-diphosphate-sugar epimerase